MGCLLPFFRRRGAVHRGKCELNLMQAWCRIRYTEGLQCHRISLYSMGTSGALELRGWGQTQHPPGIRVADTKMLVSKTPCGPNANRCRPNTNSYRPNANPCGPNANPCRPNTNPHRPNINLNGSQWNIVHVRVRSALGM